MVIFQGGTGLLARAALSPQVSCSVHCMLAGCILLQWLQQEGGLVHLEKPTAKRERVSIRLGRYPAGYGQTVHAPYKCL